MSHNQMVRSLRTRPVSPPPMGAARIPDESLTVDGAPLKIQSKFTVTDARKCSTTSFGRVHKTKVASACRRGTSPLPTPPPCRYSSKSQTKDPSPRQRHLPEAPGALTHHQHRKDAVSTPRGDAPPTVGDSFFENDSGDDTEGSEAPLFSLVPGLSSSSPTPEVSLTPEDPWQHLRRPFREDLDEGQQRKVLQELREERYKLWLERSKVGPHALRRFTRRQQGFVLAFLVVEAHTYQRLQKEKQRAPQTQRSPTIFELPPLPPPPRTSVQLEDPDDEASSSLASYPNSYSGNFSSAPNSPENRSLSKTPQDNPLNYTSVQVDVIRNRVPPPTRDMMPPPVRRPDVNLCDRQIVEFLVHDIFVLVDSQDGGDADRAAEDVRVQLQSLYLWCAAERS